MDATRLRLRAHILAALRAWFVQRGYLEVHTPVLVPSPALEATLHAVPAGGGFLHTSPEFAMKRLLGAGLGRIYQLCPCFRDEEHGRHHSREFTMLEWYRVGATAADLMDEVESLIAACAAAVGRPPPVFSRVPVATLLSPDITPHVEWFRAWVDQVEPTLTAPTIVHGYPAWQAALARVRGDTATRFEVYLGGLELANAFHEELDADEIRRRWDESDAERRAEGRAPHPRDPAFLDAVARMPTCAGIALGVDRLVMHLTDATHIRQVQAH